MDEINTKSETILPSSGLYVAEKDRMFVTFDPKTKAFRYLYDSKDIRNYIIFDMIIPNARKAFFDTIVGTVEQIFGIGIPREGYSNEYSSTNTRKK